MKANPPRQITELLAEHRGGNQAALEALMPLVYADLHSMAARYFRQVGPGHTLQPTALVHEAYLRLMEQSGTSWENRAHFFAIAARAMRFILIDHARAQHAERRGGGNTLMSLTEAGPAAPESTVDVLALDETLTRLGELDPRGARIVELRYFGGLTIDETAAVLNVSTGTVKREWRIAKAWLHRELSKGRA